MTNPVTPRPGPPFGQGPGLAIEPGTSGDIDLPQHATFVGESNMGVRIANVEKKDISHLIGLIIRRSPARARSSQLGKH